MKQALGIAAVSLVLIATMSFAGRWDGVYTPQSPTTTFAADAAAGVTITVPNNNYYKVTCDKDFRAGAGTAQTDGGWFCFDLANRCDLFRSTLGEKMYIQLSTENRIGIQAANATEVAVCRVFRQ